MPIWDFTDYREYHALAVQIHTRKQLQIGVIGYLIYISFLSIFVNFDQEITVYFDLLPYSL